MEEFVKLFRLLKEFKAKVLWSVFFNVLTAIFTLVSIPLIMPFFQILFQTGKNNVAEDASLLELKLNAFFQTLIQTYDNNKAILIVCGLIVTSFFFKNVFRYLALAIMAPVRGGIMENLRSKLYKSFLYLPTDKVKSIHKGDYLSRISADVQEVEYSILQFLQVIIQSPLIIIGSILFMVFINPQLTGLVFVLLIFIALIMGNISKFLKKDSTVLQENLGSIVSHTEESLTGWLSIRAFNTYDHWQQEFEKVNKSYSEKFKRFLWRRELSSPMSEFLGILVVVLLLALGANMVLGQKMGPESFFVFVLAFYFVIEPAKSFANAYYHLKRGSVALSRIEEISNNQQLVEKQMMGSKQINELSSIEFRNIYFKFPDSQDYVLNDLSLKISSSSSLALVGPSGSGKTSLILLLLKVYKPTKGEILINGIDLKDIDTKQWRKMLGYVPQEAFLFNDTVRNNVLFGREFDDNQIWESLDKALAKDIIDQREEGLDFGIGGSGDKLSGGQKQRISIARSLLTNPQLLIMDEPTSALDPQTEQYLSKSIETAMQGRTSIVIAHRLSTIKNADNIVMLKDGRIVEKGNHASLIDNNSLYKEYIKLQTL